MIGRILCALGIHDRHMSASFERTCKRCGAVWVAFYFQWRQDGYPIWRRVPPARP